MMPTIYLAGPILGQTVAEANDWRHEIASKLAAYGIRGISPLRCEPPGIDGTYAGGYDDPKFGHARAIASKNMLDVKACDLTLCYIPRAPRLSLGTLAELFVAFAWGKPTILVTDDPVLLGHPLVQMAAGWVLPTLQDAEDLIVGLYGDYVD